MPIDIYVSKTKKIDEHSEILNFNLADNGYYWYLYPSFEKIYDQIGKMIDLYGDADFFGQTLDILEREINNILLLIRKKSKQWNVKIGEQTHPIKKELYDTINKSDFKLLLNNLLTAINRARNEGKYLIFYGD